MKRTCAICVVALLAGAAMGQSMEDRVEVLRGRLPAWRGALNELRARGVDASYPTVTYTVLSNFVGYAAEDLKTRVPDNWGFTPVNGSQSSMEVAVGEGRGGGTAVRILNKSGYQPNRYGMLECSQVLTLVAGKPYTFSAWVKGDSPGRMGLVAGGGWRLRKEVEGTKGEWRRVALTFTPGPGDTAFQPRVVSESETDGVLFDDFFVCAGAAAEMGKNLVSNGGLEEGWTQRRAALAIEEMEGMADRLDREIAAGKSLPVPRWTGKDRPKIEGPALMAETTAGRRPVFFVGYGHFAQARNDIPKFPAYGVNVIQQEAGPMYLCPAEGKVDHALIDRLRETLHAGAKNGVAVDLLLSPHYFPAWMFAKYPDLRKQRADFFPFSVYHPAVMPFLKQYVKELLGPIKDEPALLSVCLSNEPINVEEPSDYAAAAWREWLKGRHGNLAALNGRWGTGYKSFGDVPYPNPFAGVKPSAIWVDWVRFNQEYFSRFHRMLAEAVHEVAPNVPVHEKATTWHDWRAEDVRSGDEATLMAGYSDMMGNDSVNLWGFGKDAPASGPVERGTKEFSQGWVENALGYDLLRSAKDVPVFDSENHLIFDRETRRVAPEHIRAALWQGALHGQTATTLWVWERTNNRQGDAAGSMMERPACAEALGRVCLDLNRVAVEMTALQRKAADVQILHSFTSGVWDGQAGQDALIKAYTALSFMGLKIGFITERQLEAGVLPTAKVVVVPGVNHLSAAAAKELAGYGGKVILIGGEKALSRDEYDHALPAAKGDHVAGKGPWTDLWGELREKMVMPSVTVVNAAGAAQQDVQWLSADAGGVVVSLYNPRPYPVRCRLRAEKKSEAVDLLDGSVSTLGEQMELAPLEVRMVKLR